MPEAAKYIARTPQVTIGAVTMSGKGRAIRLMPDDAEIDLEVFDEPGARAPGTTQWTLEIDTLQSFGDGGTTAEGLHDMLAPLAKTRVAFTYETFKGVAASPTTPHFTGECFVPSIPIVDAEVGDRSLFTLTFHVQGDPVKVTA